MGGGLEDAFSCRPGKQYMQNEIIFFNLKCIQIRNVIIHLYLNRLSNVEISRGRRFLAKHRIHLFEQLKESFCLVNLIKIPSHISHTF